MAHTLTITLTTPLRHATAVMEALERLAEAIPLTMETVLTSTAEAPAAVPAPPSPLRTIRLAGQAKVAYRVIPEAGTWSVGTVPERIRLYLLAYGPLTARTIEARMDLGRKSVESGLHVLRSRGLVASVPVPIDVGSV